MWDLFPAHWDSHGRVFALSSLTYLIILMYPYPFNLLFYKYFITYAS